MEEQEKKTLAATEPGEAHNEGIFELVEKCNSIVGIIILACGIVISVNVDSVMPFFVGILLSLLWFSLAVVVRACGRYLGRN